jgi:hypothetical protein
LDFAPAAVADASVVKPPIASTQTETTDSESATASRQATVIAVAIPEKFRKQQEQLFWRNRTGSDVHSSITAFGTTPMIVTSTAISWKIERAADHSGIPAIHPFVIVSHI